jgi:hypothetical protein
MIIDPPGDPRNPPLAGVAHGRFGTNQKTDDNNRPDIFQVCGGIPTLLARLLQVGHPAVVSPRDPAPQPRGVLVRRFRSRHSEKWKTGLVSERPEAFFQLMHFGYS